MEITTGLISLTRANSRAIISEACAEPPGELTRNTTAFMRDASRHLFTIGADTRARHRIPDLSLLVGEKQKTGHRTEGRPGIAVVLGNEEIGLPDAVKDACSVLVRIPGTGLMDSLNVSQAAALFMQKLFEI
jgi:TrmH RNA methyltransferase